MDQNMFLSDLIVEIFDYQDLRKESSNVRFFCIEIVTKEKKHLKLLLLKFLWVI